MKARYEPNIIELRLLEGFTTEFNITWALIAIVLMLFSDKNTSIIVVNSNGSSRSLS
jgi:hypothetical protein